MDNNKLDIIPLPIKEDLDELLRHLLHIRNPTEAVITGGFFGIKQFRSQLHDLRNCLRRLINRLESLPNSERLVKEIDEEFNWRILLTIKVDKPFLDVVNQINLPVTPDCFVNFSENVTWSDNQVKNFRIIHEQRPAFTRNLSLRFNENKTALEEYLENFRNDIAEHIQNSVSILSSTQPTNKISEQPPTSIKTDRFKYDVAISFAGENRQIADQITKALREKGINVFYDELEEEKVRLWGKNLRDEFIKIYGGQARYVIILISQYYPIKNWTNFEFDVAKDEARQRKSEYILPVRLDDTKIVGLKYEIKYIDLCKEGIDGLVDLIIKKLTL